MGSAISNTMIPRPFRTSRLQAKKNVEIPILKGLKKKKKMWRVNGCHREFTPGVFSEEDRLRYYIRVLLRLDKIDSQRHNTVNEA